MKLLLRFSTILNIFYFSILSAQSFNFNEIDTSNTEALRNLVLTPELVAAAAAKTSKRLKGILVARESAQSNRLVAESLFDTKLEAKAGWVENDKEAACRR